MWEVKSGIRAIGVDPEGLRKVAEPASEVDACGCGQVLKASWGALLRNALNRRRARGVEESVVGELFAPLEFQRPFPKLSSRDGEEVEFGGAAALFPGVELARDASGVEVVENGAEGSQKEVFLVVPGVFVIEVEIAHEIAWFGGG